VKDSEGFVFKKKESEVAKGEKVISEREYRKRSGLALYEKKFGHGGARENAGRKTKFASPLKFQIRVTKEEKEFLSYARDKKLDFAALMKIAISTNL
jgi:hypothetical protein